MNIQLGKKFWLTLTISIMVFTGFVVARNLLHALKIKSLLSDLEDEKEYYQQKITQDSTIIEQLKYDDYLEEYARTHYKMQAPKEHVYIIED